MDLFTNKGVTTNDEQGIYTIEITLTDQSNEITETYSVKLTILQSEKDPGLQCEESDELVCYTDIIDGQELENCECEQSCQPTETVVCQF